MDELQLWENRANDSFGTLVNHAYDVTKEVLGYSYTDELGIKYSVLKNVLISYMLDGNVRFYLNELKEVLTEYDICNFEEPNESNYTKLAEEILEFENSLN